MLQKLLRSRSLRTMVLVYVLIAASFVVLYSARNAAAQGQRTNLVVGLQLDMPNLDYFDVATNTIWKGYQLQYNWEPLFTFDPDYAIYADLADPARGGTACPAGSVGGPGYCVDASGLNITVYIRTGVTFTNGQPMTADDVIFTYQTLGWSTSANGISKGIWWAAPKFPLWNSTANGGNCAVTAGLPYACSSHVGVTKIDSTTVKFSFTPHSLPGGIIGGYSLAFYDTLDLPIIPSGVWKNHMLTTGLANYSSSTGAAVSDTWDRSIDTTYGSGMTQVDATVGTGPFMLTAWAKNAGSTISVYPNYWGKAQVHNWKGTNYGFSPAYLTAVNFVVYGSLDVVSLALQKGEIDTMLWSVTPGFLNQISSNPAITPYQSLDSGFFYMSFNLIKPPWNQLILREAISMAIDKDYIVNTLLGGFGTKGTVPISELNFNYVNQSASPPSFNIAGGRALLLANGYTIDPSTGFFRDPSGNPIKATILTPPKDYDPVRADAGIMISNNLKAMGLDIDAAPTSFNTIVAKFQVAPITYDIYILGWSLGPFPEAYICSFFCSDQATNINPSGSNSAQYNNPVVDQKINQALYTIDATKRQQLIKDVEGIVVNDIPWNVLYYRKNLGAYRNDVFAGWVNFPPISSASFGVFNFYTIVNLHPAGQEIKPGSTGTLTVTTSMPDQVYYRESVPISALVSQGGAPVASAAVTVNLTFGSYTTALTGTTDALGHASFTWTVPLIQGSGVATTTATSGTITGANQKVMEATIGPPLPSAQLALNTTRPVIHPAEQSVITATVTDSTGAGIAGVPITIDPALLLGTVTPAQGTTASNGVATFVYNAPANASKFPNQHLIDVVKAKVSVANTIAGDTQSASIVMVVQNDLQPNWNITSIESASPGFVVNATAPKTVIKVLVTNFADVAQAGIKVDAVYSDTKNITVTPTSVGSDTTNATGIASFNVTETAAAIAGTNNTNVVLKFQPHANAFATSDSVLLLVSAGATTPGIAARITFAVRTIAYSPDRHTDNVSARVWNQLGLPVSNVPVFFHIDYGPFGPPAQFPFTFDYGTPEYKPGGNLDASALGGGAIGGSFQNSTGQGAAYGVENMIEDYQVANDVNNLATGTTINSCDPSTWVGGFAGQYLINATSRTDALGFYNNSFYLDQEKLDSQMQVQAFIGSAAGKTLALAVNPCTPATSFVGYQGVIDSGVVSQRAPIFALGQLLTTVPGSTTPKFVVTSQSNQIELRAKFYGVDGSVVSKPQVFLTAGAGAAGRNVKNRFPANGALLAGDQTPSGNPGWAAGWVNYTRIVCNSPTTGACTVTSPLVSLSQALTFNYLPSDPRYAYSGREQLYGGDYGDYWIGPTFEVLNAKLPFTTTIAYLYLPTTTAFLKVSLAQTLLPAGGNTTATVTVYSSLTGNTISGASVWAGSTQAVTNATGVAILPVVASTLGATESLVVATTPYGGAARGWLAYVASAPVLTYSGLGVTPALVGAASTVTVTVQNTLPVAGTTTVWLTVDGNNSVAQVVSIGASVSKTLTFSYVFTTTGSHTVAVGSQSTSVTISAAPPPDNTVLYGLAIGLLVVGVVVGVVVGLMMARRGKKPPTSAPEETETKPAEEEIRPEEQL